MNPCPGSRGSTPENPPKAEPTGLRSRGSGQGLRPPHASWSFCLEENCPRTSASSPSQSSPSLAILHPLSSESHLFEAQQKAPRSLPLPPHSSQPPGVLSARWAQVPIFSGAEPNLPLEKIAPAPGPTGAASHSWSLAARALSVPKDRNPADSEG